MDKNILLIINQFIEKMEYLQNEHVLGIYFYGSYLTGYNNKHSDIDLHVIFDNNDLKHLIRGSTYIEGIRIEYFEKPIGDIYLSIQNDYQNQNNALLSIIGTSKIIIDKKGFLKQLQDYTKEKFSKPLPLLDQEDAREYVSIINNRMEKLRIAAEENSPYFIHLYHLTLEKIRKFYHRLNGLPEVQTSKVFRVYTDENYRKSFYKDKIPEDDFIQMYLRSITYMTNDKDLLLQNAESLFNYSKRNVLLNEKEDYRILIKTRNK